ncbi:hypothetical protein VU12_14120 [Desulfobulbus sp. US4]|nr:hypothetical protein [Desulfobulbus sp. US4]
MRHHFTLFALFFLLQLLGCSEEEKKAAPVPPPEVKPTAAAVQKTSPSSPPAPGCQACHSKIQTDSAHDLACTDCHQGNNETNDKESAHEGMIAQAASPEHMEATCGKCHAEQLKRCGQSSHFTMSNAVNLVRGHFDLSPLNNLTEIPEGEGPPQTKEELVNDLLRRQCLRCHVYSKGDNYPYVRHGSGCAACHLQYTDGKLTSSGEGKPNHAFIRPGKRQCLSCHYGNHVGSDFDGSYEQDHDWSYSTPFATRAPVLRPYGMELHNLVPDIHQQRGMTCLDCHSGAELSGKKPSVQCVDCHALGVSGDASDDVSPSLANLRADGKKLLLKIQGDEQERLVPRLEHPAHAKYKDSVTCQVCHAQWTYNDQATHLLLSYSDDADPWERLAAQSSSEVERFVEHNMYSEEDSLTPSLPDQVTGQRKAGIWYTGFTKRRWEDILIRKDTDGLIKVFRPILDLRLSAVDEDGEILADFDNLTGKDEGLLPYTPHTTGPAGLFYEQRFLHLLSPQDVERVDKQ